MLTYLIPFCILVACPDEVIERAVWTNWFYSQPFYARSYGTTFRNTFSGSQMLDISFTKEDARAIGILGYLDPMPREPEAISRRLAMMSEDRTIVIRHRYAETPTWDGRAPSFIIEPAIWYFDPNSRVENTGIKRWNPTAPVVTFNGGTRQTVGEFWLKGFHRYEPPPFSFGTNYLFR